MLLLPLPFPCYSSVSSLFYSTPVRETENQSQPQNTCAHHSKAALFERLLVQNGLLLLILCKLGLRRQKKQTEQHYNSTAATHALSFKETLWLAVTLYTAPLSLNADKAVKCFLSLLLFFEVAEEGRI